MTDMNSAPADLKQLYYQMLRIRRAEEAIARRYAEQQMRCPTHLCIGEEAIAVGVSAHLTNQDKVFSNHRGHGHYLAKGGDLPRLLAELYGYAEGCCGGRGGSMHLTDLKAGFVASTPIVGGTVPLAAGYAWAEQMKKSGAALGCASVAGGRMPEATNVVVIFFGDGCFEEGVMHETMNFAVLKQLPLLFICENNQYSVMTPLAERQPKRDIYKIAAAHGLNAVSGDGNRVDEVYELARIAVGNTRNGLGPQFLELHTHRWPEHCGPNEDDDLGYRSPGELAEWKLRCPLLQTRQTLLDAQLSDDAELAQMETRLADEIEQAFSWALQGTRPTIESMRQHLYA
ncbi:thiamine pyrophosphate-dependent dehydrogenase E1 component subunit alpha [Methylomonas sp. ZR1]|uniref:thiamine pyrophosphate-dependent dehydrogenase E1 component subunit alpha n=1 Tax=unclassified Methylomonas TaxID=2608980 RepID=UPI00149145D3|nr:thiamine pyrophosphate-dependent dehydrogenase E1 component subunit alpha [Methylomonas sp. ZR1]NOV31090.1 thiamine pyrophosphate-dependent dehydrogenase E1 component subunit alpha [Methylomonas sp. ZR1]